MYDDSKTEQFVIFRGQRMITGWPEKIEEAQTIKTYTASERQYDRIKYGEELHRQTPVTQPCRDCAVLECEFHVPGCDGEECPKCQDQALGCGCKLKITALH